MRRLNRPTYLNKYSSFMLAERDYLALVDAARQAEQSQGAYIRSVLCPVLRDFAKSRQSQSPA